MTPERQEYLRKNIAKMLCVGCRRDDPLDKHGRHVHNSSQEAFGSTWVGQSWIACAATPALVERWLTFIELVIEEEKAIRRGR